VGVLDDRKHNRATRLHKDSLTQALLGVNGFADNVSGETWPELQEIQSFSYNKALYTIPWLSQN